ncbi:hypothetical protein ACC785_38265, partial [Rhizobium ruizarguesonis]
KDIILTIRQSRFFVFLAYIVHDFGKPSRRKVKSLAALYAREFYSAQFTVLAFIVAGDAERSLVQKSGYFARSAPANGDDL